MAYSHIFWPRGQHARHKLSLKNTQLCRYSGWGLGNVPSPPTSLYHLYLSTHEDVDHFGDLKKRKKVFMWSCSSNFWKASHQINRLFSLDNSWRGDGGVWESLHQPQKLAHITFSPHSSAPAVFQHASGPNQRPIHPFIEPQMSEYTHTPHKTRTPIQKRICSPISARGLHSLPCDWEMENFKHTAVK